MPTLFKCNRISIPVSCSLITDPQGLPIPTQLPPVDRDHTRVEFTPVEVGGHLISLQYNGQNVMGSPYTSYAHDAARVRITDCDSSGSVGRECGFTGKYCRVPLPLENLVMTGGF